MLLMSFIFKSVQFLLILKYPSLIMSLETYKINEKIKLNENIFENLNVLIKACKGTIQLFTLK